MCFSCWTGSKLNKELALGELARWWGHRFSSHPEWPGLSAVGNRSSAAVCSRTALLPPSHRPSSSLLLRASRRLVHLLRVHFSHWGGEETSWAFYFHLLLRSQCPEQCLTLEGPHGLRPPGSSVHGILQARMLEGLAALFPRGAGWPRDLNPGLLHCRQIFPPSELTGKSWPLIGAQR